MKHPTATFTLLLVLPVAAVTYGCGGGAPAASAPHTYELGTTLFGTDVGVRGVNTAGGVAVRAEVALQTTGTKNFIQPHPTDPTKQIVYTAGHDDLPDVRRSAGGGGLLEEVPAAAD